MPLDGSRRLIPDTRLVHLRCDHVQQVKRIINSSGREALDLLRFATTALAGAGALRGHSGSGDEPTVRSDGTRACGLGLRLRTGDFLHADLGYRGFFLRCRCLFLCEQSRVLCFTRQLRLALLLLLLLGFVVSCAILPLGCLCPFLEEERRIISIKKRLISKGGRTFVCSAAARLFASFSAFFARPLSFLPFPPFGAMIVSTWLLSGVRAGCECDR